MRILITVVLVCTTASLLLAEEHKVTPAAQCAFTFKDKPIHPGVVSEFEVWLSDGDPARVKAVDLESCTTSNKNVDPAKKEGDYLTCKAGMAGSVTSTSASPPRARTSCSPPPTAAGRWWR